MAGRSILINIGAGSEPELIEIDDAREAIGMIEDTGEHCERSADGRHSYSISDGGERCIHCGREPGS